MEARVYGVDYEKVFDDVDCLTGIGSGITIPDNEFIEIAEKQGYVWSLNGFQHDYNISDIKDTIVIRII